MNAHSLRRQYGHPQWVNWPISPRGLSAIVLTVTVEPKGKDRDVNYFADFDWYVIGERNEGIRREVRTLRLERRLRENGELRPGARLAAFVTRSTLPLLRRAGLAG
jgi:hypothetical protein